VRLVQSDRQRACEADTRDPYDLSVLHGEGARATEQPRNVDYDESQPAIRPFRRRLPALITAPYFGRLSEIVS
jgi:hypothetical protein